MRYLSILIAVTLTMLFTSACQEESQPVAKEAPQKVMEKAKQEVASAVETSRGENRKSHGAHQGRVAQIYGACQDRIPQGDGRGPQENG